MTHPDDPRGPLKLPTYITSPTPKQKTLDKARAVIEKMGYPPRVATSDLFDEFTVQDAPRMLYFLGYTPSVVRGARGMRLWDAPADLDKRFRDQALAAAAEIPNIEVPTPLEVAHDLVGGDPTAMDDAAAETLAYKNPGKTIQEAADPEWLAENAEPDPEGEIDDLEFIDMRDSWVVDPQALLGEPLHRMLKDRLGTLNAVGIDWEIRVWRR